MKENYQIEVNMGNPVISKKRGFMELLDESKKIIMAWEGGHIDISCDENKQKTELSSIELVRDLEENDWDTIIDMKPIIVGSSDITTFLCSLLNHGINCYYGPNFKTTLINTCDSKRKITMKYLLMALNDKNEYTINWALQELNSENAKPWIILPGKERTGRLVGGNLTTLSELHENNNDYMLTSESNNILLLEENEASYFIKDNKVINSQLTKFENLMNSGIIDNMRGLIIGRTKLPLRMDIQKPITNKEERGYIEGILDDSGIMKYCERKSIPILGNVSCSHTHPMVTLPLGRMVTLNAGKQTLKIHSKIG